MKIDAQQHFCNYASQEYGWVKEGMEVLHRTHVAPTVSFPGFPSRGTPEAVARRA